MNYLSKMAASVGLTLVLAGALLAQTVKTDYDRNANFSQYKTFSWEKVPSTRQWAKDGEAVAARWRICPSSLLSFMSIERTRTA